MVGGDGVDTRRLRRARLAGLLARRPRQRRRRAAENDLIGADVENIEGVGRRRQRRPSRSSATAARTASRSPSARAIITGGEGADVLEGGPQDDTINSRDGSPDTVICNGGTDTVIADTLDTDLAQRARTCRRRPRPAARSTTARRRSPGPRPRAGASLTANAATTLAVNATDDRGLTRVQFFDDDRLVCEDTAAPYSCAYQPRGGDVGRNTLIAVATDGANQTTSVVRAVTVRRFAPQGARARAAARAATARRPTPSAPPAASCGPDPVSPSQGCSGTVTLTAKRGSKVVSTKRVDALAHVRVQRRRSASRRAPPAEPAHAARSSAATSVLSTTLVEEPAPPAWARFRGPMQIEGMNALVAGGRVRPWRRHRPRACTKPAPTSRSPTSTPSAGPRSPRSSARASSPPTSPTPTQVEAAVAAGRGRRRPADLGLLRRHRPGREDRRQPRPARLRAVRDRHPRQPDRHLQRAPPRGRGDARQRRPTTRASAASTSTRPRSPPTTARSARSPTRPPRAASSA